MLGTAFQYAKYWITAQFFLQQKLPVYVKNNSWINLKEKYILSIKVT